MLSEEGNIIYKKLSASDEHATHIAKYLGYNELGNEWFVYRMPHLSVESKKIFEDQGMQVYLPTYRVKQAHSKKKNINPDCSVNYLEKPKILDYIFVLTDLEHVNSLAKYDNVKPLYKHYAKENFEEFRKKENYQKSLKAELEKKFLTLQDEINDLKEDLQHSEIQQCAKSLLLQLKDFKKTQLTKPQHNWLTVPFNQMHSMMILVEGFEKEVVFCTPDEQLLKKGDRVRVVGGDYKGIEGILLTNQGASGGKIYVAISNNWGTMTANIKDECIQVLEFSKNTNHFYYKIASFEKLLDKYIALKVSGKSLSAKQIASLEFFLFRYAHLTGLSRINLAKLNICRYVVYKLLGKEQDAKQCLEFYEEEISRNKQSRRTVKRSNTVQIYINKWKEKISLLNVD